MSTLQVLLILDLAGTFAFSLNGALTAVRAAHLDIVGVLTLGLITAVGGGVIRDVLLGTLPPATFLDGRYLVVALGGGLIVFLFGRWLDRIAGAIDVLDAAGLSLFAVTGAGKALAAVRMPKTSSALFTAISITMREPDRRAVFTDRTSVTLDAASSARMIGCVAATGLARCDQRPRAAAAVADERPGQGRRDPRPAAPDHGA